MTTQPMSEWSDRAGTWAPSIVVLLIWLCLVLVRLTGLALLPRNAFLASHPWHAAYLFFVFDW